MQLAVAGSLAEAQAAFAEVVRVRPDYAEGRLNLGMALARQGKLNLALEQFQAALRLEPSDKRASQFIETIEHLQSHQPGP
jgi:tetratricopeptide (TPR) repeat protein